MALAPSTPDTATVALDASHRADRRIGVAFLRLLAGLTLLACSVIAGWLWTKPLYPSLPAAASNSGATPSSVGSSEVAGSIGTITVWGSAVLTTTRLEFESSASL